MNASKTGRRYDKLFKQDAVALVHGGREIVAINSRRRVNRPAV